jgi:hypothetical protein
MENFLLSIPLATGLITGHRLTLDGLLGGIVFKRTGDPAQVLDGLPLARSHGIYHASAALLESPCQISRHIINASFVAEARRDLGFAATTRPDGSKLPRIDGKRGLFRTETSEFAVYETAAVHFLGRGDTEDIRRLLRTVGHIGTKRSHGFGQIARPTDDAAHPVRLETEAVDQSSPWFGIFAQGSVLRPVPVRLLPAFGVTPARYRTAHETWRNPYRDRQGRETCLVPVATVHHPAEIRRLCQ